jgi:hypothetical protein
MSQLVPQETTVNDICTAALKECGAVGQGQSPTGDELNDAWARLQWMLQEWGEDTFLVWRQRTITVQQVNTNVMPTDPDMGTSTKPVWYFPVGPGAGIQGGFETGADNTTVTPTQSISVAPRRVKAAFLRQPGGAGSLPIDYPLRAFDSMQDYARIALKGMVSFPGSYYYDPAWPLGRLFLYPLPTNSIYGVGIVIRDQLPIQFVTSQDVFELPFIYFNAFYLNLAVRLRPHYGMRTFPGDELPALAKGARSAIKNTSVQIAELQLPQELSRPGIYNIFSDQSY